MPDSAQSVEVDLAMVLEARANIRSDFRKGKISKGRFRMEMRICQPSEANLKKQIEDQ